MSSATEERELPRRCYIDQMKPAELAIRDAIMVVESAGAHPMLTAIVQRLGCLQTQMADYVDGVRYDPLPENVNEWKQVFAYTAPNPSQGVAEYFQIFESPDGNLGRFVVRDRAGNTVWIIVDRAAIGEAPDAS